MYQSDGNSSYQSDLYSNISSMALMFTMCSPVFGNGNFVVQPATPGDVQAGFPSVPYLSLEAVIYQQQASNPMTAPNNVTSGQTAGQQTIAGSQTQSDATGINRMQTGVA